MGGEKTREWLVNGILAGQASDVRVRLRGDLREFPFADPSRGEFQRHGPRSSAACCSYAEGWPRIENIEGELAVRARPHGRSPGAAARILGAALANVEARHPRARDRRRRSSQVSGEARGATAEFLKFIETSRRCAA